MPMRQRISRIPSSIVTMQPSQRYTTALLIDMSSGPM
jgi:hypothetical protein